MSQQRPSNEESDLRRDILLTAQVALLGELSSAVRGITLAWSADRIHLRAVFSGEITEGDRESMECVGTEIMASFPTHRVEVECLRLDAPAQMKSLFLMAWAYLRKEPS